MNSAYSKLYSGEDEPKAEPSRYRVYRWYILSALCLLAVISTATLSFKSLANSGSQISRTAFPEIPLVETEFRAHHKYMGDDEQSDRAWEELLPAGLGYIGITDASDYGLPPGSPSDDPDVEIYGLSVFHQLHCLAILRDTLFALRAGRAPKHAGPVHAEHCFDFLRQAIMCHGDTTIEHPHLSGEGENLTATVDGYVVNHQCRSWDVLVGAAEDRRARDGTEKIGS